MLSPGGIQGQNFRTTKGGAQACWPFIPPGEHHQNQASTEHCGKAADSPGSLPPSSNSGPHSSCVSLIRSNAGKGLTLKKTEKWNFCQYCLTRLPRKKDRGGDPAHGSILWREQERAVKRRRAEAQGGDCSTESLTCLPGCRAEIPFVVYLFFMC